MLIRRAWLLALQLPPEMHLQLRLYQASNSAVGQSFAPSRAWLELGASAATGLNEQLAIRSEEPRRADYCAAGAAAAAASGSQLCHLATVPAAVAGFAAVALVY